MAIIEIDCPSSCSVQIEAQNSGFASETRPSSIADAIQLLDEGLGRGWYTSHYLEKISALDDHAIVLAKSPDGAIAGIGIASPITDLQFYQPFGPEAVQRILPTTTASISALSVKPGLRNHGIGTMLLTALEQWLTRRGYLRSIAVSWISGGPNPSEPLFIKAGYELLSRADDVYLELSIMLDVHCVSCQGPCHCPAALYCRRLRHDLGMNTGSRVTSSASSNMAQH